MIFLRPGNPVAWRAAPHRRVRRGIGINVTVGRSAMQTGGRRAGPPRPVAPPCLRFVVGDVVAAQADKLTAVAAPAALGPGRRLRRAGGLAGADAAARAVATTVPHQPGFNFNTRAATVSLSGQRDRSRHRQAGVCPLSRAVTSRVDRWTWAWQDAAPGPPGRARRLERVAG